MRKGQWLGLVVTALSLCATARIAAAAERVRVVTDPNASPRVKYGAERVAAALKGAGVEVSDSAGASLLVGTRSSELLKGKSGDAAALQAQEGFAIAIGADGSGVVAGTDDSGVLYGCLELASRISAAKRLPANLQFADAPVFRLRGPCIGMQKTYILPGRKVYEYPYTPELFPFFYDKGFWREYLDFLAQNRMNTLYLWNGHPFSSLVKLEDYPYAVEVSDDVLARNREMYHWITQEADRRGIWVVQMFYNLLLPKPLAEKHGFETQLASPNAVAADYTRKSIAEFVKQYPHVGLMVCLGEALQGIDNQRSWLTETILPGVKDGMALAGLKDEPPVVIRTHATDLRKIMPDALKVYRNLYTEQKFNGESLTTWEPRGTRQDLHLAMSRLGSTHVSNVHILANLEPFRYGDVDFIRRSVLASRDRLGARGLHLYPLFYWNWPDSPDVASPPLKQWERDWIWFEAWARYSWNPDVDVAQDRKYWLGRLGARYGADAAEPILDAYNFSGECAPRILRRFGITEGNRQTMSLGMTLDQLVTPERYRPFPELWESQAPPGERLQEYAEREWKKQPHEGETPPQIVAEVLDYSKRAVDAAEAAAGHVTSNRAEFDRLRNDVLCIRAMSQNYAAKVNAAMLVLRYNHSKDPADMQRAAGYLAESLEHYRTLVRLTDGTYTAANSMQTSQRRIPVPGGADGKPANYHWKQLLPIYEKELADFRQRVEGLKGEPVAGAVDESTIKALPPAPFKLLTASAQTYHVEPGQRVFSDREYTISSVAPELVGLTGVRFAHEDAKNGRHEPIEFETDQPVQVLVGYFKDPRPLWLKPPDLETDAAAVERGGGEPVLQNAATIDTLPPLDVYAMRFDKGRHKLELRGKGGFVVLGVVPQTATIARRDAKRPGGGAL